jgi:hypothetical protein
MRTSSGRNFGARLGAKRLVYRSTCPTSILLGAGRRSSQCTLGALLTDRRTSLLLDWATSAGLQLPKIKPAEFDDGLRGMVAEQKVSFGDVLVSVPADKAFLAVENESCPFPDSVAPDFWQRSPLWVKVALKLVHERRQGEASPWHAWVANLPQDIQLPLLWADTLLDELQYPHIIAKVAHTRTCFTPTALHRRDGVWHVTCTCTQMPGPECDHIEYGVWVVVACLAGTAVHSTAALGRKQMGTDPEPGMVAPAAAEWIRRCCRYGRSGRSGGSGTRSCRLRCRPVRLRWSGRSSTGRLPACARAPSTAPTSRPPPFRRSPWVWRCWPPVRR